jgi:hypothetical protein
MKVCGIHILKDHTLQVLLESARNTALNEIAYQKILDQRQDAAANSDKISKKKGPAFPNLILVSPVGIESTTT